jgi:hypothetical protein
MGGLIAAHIFMEAIVSTEQYDDVCKGEFKEIKGLIEKQTRSVDKLYKRLFIGNGVDPITMQIDRLNRFKVVATWFSAAICLAWIGIISKAIYEVLRSNN